MPILGAFSWALQPGQWEALGCLVQHWSVTQSCWPWVQHSKSLKQDRANFTEEDKRVQRSPKSPTAIPLWLSVSVDSSSPVCLLRQMRVLNVCNRELSSLLGHRAESGSTEHQNRKTLKGRTWNPDFSPEEAVLPALTHLSDRREG